MSKIPIASNIEITYEKCLPTTISLICWSPKIDVCAFASEAGDLYLFRYNPWQKVWDIPPREDHSKFTVLEWSRDQLMLAAGRDNGCVELLEVEKGTSLLHFSISVEVVCLSWSLHELSEESDFLKSLGECNENFHAFFGPLPKLENVENSCRIQDALFEPNLQKKYAKYNVLSVLLIGCKNGDVWVNIDGFFCPSSFNVISENNRITALRLSTNLTEIVITHCDDRANIFVSIAKTTFFTKFNNETRVLAHQFKLIYFLLHYMSTVINVMSESYEAVLTKLDEKLAKFVELLPDDVLVVDEFLKLLSMGNNRPEILPFISRDLSFSNPRNKKLPNDIETSHQNLTTVIKNHLLPSSEMLYYKLTQVERVCKLSSFEKLGFKSKAFESCSMLTGTFMLKTFELLHVTQTTKESFQVFFEWINIVGDKIQGLEQHTDKTLSMKQYEILIEFLMNQLQQSGKPPCVKFNVELVEQYFMLEDLTCQQENKSPWLKLAEEVLPEDFPLIRPDPSASLIQIMQKLQNRVKDSFHIASTTISELFKEIAQVKIKSISASAPPIILQHKEAVLIIVALNPPFDRFVIVLRYALGEFHYAFISLTGLQDAFTIESVREYNDKSFVLLVRISLAEQKDKYFLYFVPFYCLDEAKYYSTSYEFPPTGELHEIALVIPDSSCVCFALDRFQVSQWDVTATRKLAGFVSQDKKRLRVYDLDSCEEKIEESTCQESMDESTLS